jgi:hypothetical protein
VFVSGGFDLCVHLHPPGFAEVALAHANRVSRFAFLLRRRLGGTAGFGFAASGRTNQNKAKAKSYGGKEWVLEICHNPHGQ